MADEENEETALLISGRNGGHVSGYFAPEQVSWCKFLHFGNNCKIGMKGIPTDGFPQIPLSHIDNSLDLQTASAYLGQVSVIWLTESDSCEVLDLTDSARQLTIRRWSKNENVS